MGVECVCWVMLWASCVPVFEEAQVDAVDPLSLDLCVCVCVCVPVSGV